jgi:hypothetical protein
VVSRFSAVPRLAPFFKPGFRIRIRIRIGSGFNQVIGSGSVFGIRIRIQEGKNDLKNLKKFRNFMFEVLDVLF